MNNINHVYNYTSPTGELIAKKEYYKEEDGTTHTRYISESGLATTYKEGIPIFYNFEVVGKSKPDEPVFLVSNEATADLLTNMGMTAVSSSFPLTSKSKNMIDKLFDNTVKEVIGKSNIYVLLDPTTDEEETKFRTGLKNKLSKNYSGVFFVNLSKDFFWEGHEDQKPEDKPIRVFQYLKEFPDALSRILTDIENTRSRAEKIQEGVKKRNEKRQAEALLLADEKTKELLEPVIDSDFDASLYPVTASYIERYAKYACGLQTKISTAEENGKNPKNVDIERLDNFGDFVNNIADGSEQDREDIEFVLGCSVNLKVAPPKIAKDKLVNAVLDHCHPFCLGNTIYYYKEKLGHYESGDEDNFQSYYQRLSDLLANPANSEYNRNTFGKTILKRARGDNKAEEVQKRLEFARGFLTFQNGVLDVAQKKLVAPSWEQYQKDILSTDFVFEYLYDDAAFKKAFEKSRFSQFLDECFREPETADALQMVFGLFLIPNLKEVHKLFFLSGSGGNGKGVIFELLESIFQNSKQVIGSVGFENMCQSQFGFATLSGKRANLAKDTRLTGDILMSDSVKQLSGGDTNITVNPKYEKMHQEDFNMTLISGINTPIVFSEKTNAMKRRVMYFPFKSQFGTEEDVKRDLERGVGNVTKLMDPHLKDKLRSELGLIVMWALRGYYRLKDEYDWKIPESCEMMAERDLYDAESNTFDAFIRMYGKIDASVTPDTTKKENGGSKMYIAFGVLSRAYQDWMTLDRGDRRALGDSSIRQHIRQVYGLTIEQKNLTNYTGGRSNIDFVFGLNIDKWIEEMHGRGYDDEDECRRLHPRGVYPDLYSKKTLYGDPEDPDASEED